MGAKISGATIWTGVDGCGKRSMSTVRLEGMIIYMRMIIELIEEYFSVTSADKKNDWRYFDKSKLSLPFYM
jgi:PII-like signaling protein